MTHGGAGHCRVRGYGVAAAGHGGREENGPWEEDDVFGSRAKAPPYRSSLGDRLAP